MQLTFVPIEEFYFALTLSLRTLEEFRDPALVERVRSQLAARCGEPSTVSAGPQNNFNYVFKVENYDNHPSDQLVISIADWNNKLRLSSDYGWTLDESRKTIKTEKFDQRSHFAQELRQHLETWLGIDLEET
ncbi:hypothetical protein L3556_12065 [Candidatus Synechococcus calcipolaris G9]|uniref:Uncharacterized protein n=1 Tax=Candidatus Synechococcus calcipolaris G9 TaxID=1497997 RepID=A0ABT6F1D2_9SYNE|nr:hypothetical protein [Candidatus Synechococcus calcipolaris]MDG2991662.1 hypothetical protein [Candidatus Synechococcus calcipolaris G9]